MNSDEHRIREFAFQIWEAEGRPEGRSKEHWERACKLVESENLAENQSVLLQQQAEKADKKMAH